MVHGIADDVRQRVLDRLDDRLIEFRLLPLHLDPHFFAAAQRQVAHLRGNLLQMFPIGCMRVFITPSCSSVVIRFSRWLVASKLASSVVAELQDLIARQHQFADQVHQPVEQAHFHPDGAVAGAAGARLLLQVQRFHKFLRFNGALFYQNLSDAPRIALLLLLYRVVNVDNLRRSPLDQDFPDVRFRLHFRALPPLLPFCREALLL